jgi:hypothetical protein
MARILTRRYQDPLRFRTVLDMETTATLTFSDTLL